MNGYRINEVLVLVEYSFIYLKWLDFGIIKLVIYMFEQILIVLGLSPSPKS